MAISDSGMPWARATKILLRSVVAHDHPRHPYTVENIGFMISEMTGIKKKSPAAPGSRMETRKASDFLKKQGKIAK